MGTCEVTYTSPDDFYKRSVSVLGTKNWDHFQRQDMRRILRRLKSQGEDPVQKGYCFEGFRDALEKEFRLGLQRLIGRLDDIRGIQCHSRNYVQVASYFACPLIPFKIRQNFAGAPYYAFLFLGQELTTSDIGKKIQFTKWESDEESSRWESTEDVLGELRKEVESEKECRRILRMSAKSIPYEFTNRLLFNSTTGVVHDSSKE